MRKDAKKRGRPKKLSPEEKSFTSTLTIPTPINTITPMVPGYSSRSRKNPACPECGAHPVIRQSKGKGKNYFRCRICGNRFAIIE